LIEAPVLREWFESRAMCRPHALALRKLLLKPQADTHLKLKFITHIA
jgi:hypothetical protein